MKKAFFIFAVMLVLSFAALAQTDTSTTQSAKAKQTIFRATKDQIIQVQKMLKITESGKMDTTTRSAIKTYQSENGLNNTGTLNRATLEKMNVPLNEKQKEIPIVATSYAPKGEDKAAPTKEFKGIFRASKEQITEVQTMLKTKGMYSGEPTGKLDDATRDGIKKFQTDNGVKVTGTLNKETLEKMGITLTQKQKEM